MGVAGIGVPYNVQRMLHVDINYTWEGVAEDNFTIEEKLGEGFALFLFRIPELLFSVRTAPHTRQSASAGRERKRSDTS